jgi:hypothetical protein
MGGFMALKMAEYFPKAHVFAYNPQTDFLAYRTFHPRGQGRIDSVLRQLKIDADHIPPEWKVCMAVHPEIVNPVRTLVYVQNKADEHHYQSHFQPFWHSVPRDLSGFASTLLIKDPRSLELHKGLNAVEFNDPVKGHESVGRDFELPVMDLILQFMVKSSTSDH